MTDTITLIDHDEWFGGTCLQGYVNTTYARLVECFGPPTDDWDGVKVDARWLLQTPAGVASIYNYKDGPNYMGQDGKPVEEITDWHVGGHDSSVLGPIRKKVYGDEQ